MITGSEALRVHAPDAGGALAGLEAAAWRAADAAGTTRLVERVSGACAGLLDLDPLTAPSGSSYDTPTGTDPVQWRLIDGLTDAERVALEFAEQFTLDVSSISAAQRSALTHHLGRKSADFVASVFVMDFLPRTRAGLDALFATAPSAGGGSDPGDAAGATELWDAIDLFTRVVPRLDAVDPVTSELIRLRGARQHRCRLCTSLRSRPSLLAGADERTFSAVDAFEDSDLSPWQKAALSFTDAMIWTPGHVDAAVADAVVVTSEPAQRVELVLDVTRNALNKIAVALGADAPHVEDGFEIYDIDAAGELVYGLSLD